MLSVPKLVILVLIIAAVYFFFIKKRDKKNSDKEVEQMVECKSCGTFISTKEAFIQGGKYYCSKECAYS